MSQKVVGIVAKNSIGYVEEVFAAIRSGDVAVALRNESDEDRIDLSAVQETITPNDLTGWVEGLEYPVAQGSEEDLAQILFTSGTEGESKAILLSRSALENTTDRLISVMELTSDIREYVGIPVHYSFGFGRCRAVAKAGGAFYVPPNGFDISEISQMLERGEINAVSAVPSLWRIVLEMQELFADCGSNLRWIEIGSQYMSGAEKAQLKALFPNAKIVQHYGLTEASRSTFLKVHEAEGDVLESVGVPIDDVEISISESGNIRIKGSHLASGLIKSSGKAALVDSEGWFVTSDSGRLENGVLYYEGRTDDIINCNGIKLSPDQIEQSIFAQLDISEGVVVSKARDEMRGEVPLLCYLNEGSLDQESLKRAAVRVLRKQGLEAGNILKFLGCESFPVTQTGKIQRKKLTELFEQQNGSNRSNSSIQSDAQQLSEKTKPIPESQDKTAELVSIWEEVLKVSSISIDDSFFDLGGDSLSAISVTMKMEKAGIPKETCRRIFEGLSIAQIVALQASVKVPMQAKSEPQSAPEQSGKTKELVAIWEEVLKVSPISVDDSFFDLGGDSLSAISVTMKMEKAGIPKETCRRIFEGLSISQIVAAQPGASAANNVVEQASPEPSEKTAELVGIWEEVLKVSPISVNDSFFDLGGDSLSAITVTMKMEKAGIPKETCRRIFEGLSISQIVAEQGEEQSAPDVGIAPNVEAGTQAEKNDSDPSVEQIESGKTPLAAASQSLNIVRGLLVLMNVASHWMPGVIERIPGVFAEINRYFAPLYSSGTPGFAIVFGSGIGFFFLPRYRKDPKSVMAVTKRNAILLAVGILLFGVLSTIAAYARGEEITALVFSNSLWSVLTFYLFAVLSLPLWLLWLTRQPNFSFACLTMSVVFYGTHMVLDSMNIPPSENAFIQPFVLLLTAKYNYFEMASGVLLGAAVGNWIRESVLNQKSLNPFAYAGVLLIVLSVVISHELGEEHLWTVWPKGSSLWTWPLYLGCVLVAVTLVQRYFATKVVSGGWDLTGKTLSIIGILAFPIFIAHELVIPVKDILTAMSVPFALTIALGTFFIGAVFMTKRLYGIYYGKD